MKGFSYPKRLSGLQLHPAMQPVEFSQIGQKLDPSLLIVCCAMSTGIGMLAKAAMAFAVLGNYVSTGSRVHAY